MNAIIAIRKPKSPVHRWRWRDRSGRHHHPRDMETRHLFYTLRMIWNHSMPVQIGRNVKLYSFPPVYTEGYMRSAIYHIGVELAERDDLLRWQLEELRQMAEYFDPEDRLTFTPKLKHRGSLGEP